jgi:hypothetical protein
MKKKVSKELELLNKEIAKDKLQLDISKKKLINELTKLKKEDILPPPPIKLTLWQRIKKVLME